MNFLRFSTEKQVHSARWTQELALLDNDPELFFILVGTGVVVFVGVVIILLRLCCCTRRKSGSRYQSSQHLTASQLQAEAAISKKQKNRKKNKRKSPGSSISDIELDRADLEDSMLQNYNLKRNKKLRKPKAAAKDVRYKGLEAPNIVKIPAENSIPPEIGKGEEDSAIRNTVSEVGSQTGDASENLRGTRENQGGLSPVHSMNAAQRMSIGSIATQYLDYAMKSSRSHLSIFRPSTKYLNRQKLRKENKRVGEKSLNITDDDL